MDQESHNRFDTLRKTDPNAWTVGDREFMSARRDYLSEDEVKAFGLGASQADTEPAPKKSKKADSAE